MMFPSERGSRVVLGESAYDFPFWDFLILVSAAARAERVDLPVVTEPYLRRVHDRLRIGGYEILGQRCRLHFPDRIERLSDDVEAIPAGRLNKGGIWTLAGIFVLTPPCGSMTDAGRAAIASMPPVIQRAVEASIEARFRRWMEPGDVVDGWFDLQVSRETGLRFLKEADDAVMIVDETKQRSALDDAILSLLNEGARPGKKPAWGAFHKSVLDLCDIKDPAPRGFGLRTIQDRVKALREEYEI